MEKGKKGGHKMTEKHQCETTLINCPLPAYEKGSDSRWLCPEHLKEQREWDAFIENKRIESATRKAAGVATAGLSLSELQAVKPEQIRALPELIVALKVAQEHLESFWKGTFLTQDDEILQRHIKQVLNKAEK